MNWLVLAGSLVAILALAGVAWLLRLGRDGKVEDASVAAQAVEDALAGFRAEGALVSDDDLAAIVTGDGGRVAVVKCHGVNLAVREVRWSAVRSTHEGIEVETGDRRFGLIKLKGVDVLDVRRMARSLTSV
ncbi:hypothetical protein ACFO8O_05585 [Hephaestia sp. GCM10023244]|uniref:hypothetical protein n=1 Tax=unclassified Hephaestia TaxID=2631281 RepID=UPI002077510B|nr:hypothetical protein [Hephaestia sp. MAHUQ-44]MCM8730439.1 hypothetical protein [Hephaestia sp. MAHUQ-44]